VIAKPPSVTFAVSVTAHVEIAVSMFAAVTDGVPINAVVAAVAVRRIRPDSDQLPPHVPYTVPDPTTAEFATSSIWYEYTPLFRSTTVFDVLAVPASAVKILAVAASVVVPRRTMSPNCASPLFANRLAAYANFPYNSASDRDPPITLEQVPLAVLLTPPPIVAYVPLATFDSPPMIVAFKALAAFVEPPAMLEYELLAELPYPPPTNVPSVEAVFELPPAMVLYVPLATCEAAERLVCQSTAFVPRLLPPVAVLSATCAVSAPVPFGLSARSALVVVAAAVMESTYTVAFGDAVDSAKVTWVGPDDVDVTVTAPVAPDTLMPVPATRLVTPPVPPPSDLSINGKTALDVPPPPPDPVPSGPGIRICLYCVC